MAVLTLRQQGRVQRGSLPSSCFSGQVMHQEITHRKLAETEAVARANALGTINQLTPREAEVMRLVVRGEPNKKIARILDISVKTVEMHRSNLMKKLSVNSVPELVRMAVLAFPEWRVPDDD